MATGKQIADALEVLFPDADETADWIVVETNGVGRIAEWNLPDPQPNNGQIMSVNAQQKADAKKNKQFKRGLELSKKDRVLIKWIADLHGLTPAQARNQLRQIWDALP